MGMLICMGAMMECSFGAAPSSLVVPPVSQVLTGTPAATIMDNVPMENVPSFGMCMSIANPEVASETAAALGVLTPAPCIPLLPAPWVVGAPTVLIGNFPALDDAAKLMCAWGGVIQITAPGEFTVQVP
jgi:hypothetical protein